MCPLGKSYTKLKTDGLSAGDGEYKEATRKSYEKTISHFPSPTING